MATTRTLCPYCGVGCGLLVEHDGARVATVKGDPLHPTNRGRTCRKPLELPSAVHAPDRATVPLWREDRDGRFEPRGWDEALAGIASRLSAYAPEEIAFYISGQLLTEDYYAVNKLAKGFLGTNNVDSNSRLCMSSAVAGYSGAFGFDGPPPAYADLDLADVTLLLGSNAAACHPIVWSRIRDRQAEGGFVICVDPRATPTARAADLHLPVRPGTDLPLLNAMLHVIDAEGMIDATFVARHTSGWEEARAVAAEWSPERAAAVCGVEAAAIVTAARRFATAGAAMALWSMGANQSTVGTLKNRALINLCLAAGQLGRPGAGPLSLTGQPNAMGGRETGGLAHLLPGYRRVDDPDDRAAMEAHWGGGPIAPAPGLAAVELFDALAEGRVKAVWVVATNPLVSLPDAARARAALKRAELVIVQDAFHPTETGALAHAILPAASWPEKTGTMTSSERRIGLVEAATAPPGAARADWEIFAGVGRELGFADAFGWASAAEVFDEYAAATAGRPCDLSGVSHARLRERGSLQWPCPAASDGTPRLYADRRFPTPDRRARFAPTPHADPVEAVDADFPLRLTTGRIAEQWHTMTRTGKSPRLRAAAGDPFVELHPEDAPGVREGDPVTLRSRRGAVRLRARLLDTLPRGVAFAPFHWGALHAPAGAGTVNAVTHGAVDPTSKQPELKAIAVRLEPATTTPLATPHATPHATSHAGVWQSEHRHGARIAKGPKVGRPSAAERRLVVVGTGMAGQAVVEEALRRRDGWRVTMLGEEEGPAYNRVLVSKLLAGDCGPGDLVLKPAAWYAEHGIDLRGGCRAQSIDPANRVVVDRAGERHPYDALVLATGSRPVFPPIPGIDGPHVVAFRTPRDVDALLAAHPRRAVVIGGGLLGLEAAAGLQARGARVTVVDVADRLMARQLDRAAARMLRRAIEGLGLGVELGIAPVAVTRAGVLLADGRHLDADLVVCAAGVRPETALARSAGLEVAHGIVVDDQLRTSAPGVWAVGECAEHRGTVYGLWAPLAAQARAAGAGVAGDPATFTGIVPATVLKVAGVDVFAGGVPEGDDELIAADTRRGTYRKLVLDGDRLAGALLVGDVSEARALSELLRSGEPVPEALLSLAATADPDGRDGGDDAATVCSCNAVTRGAILDAIRRGGLTTAAQVARATGASTGCGSCAGDVRALLQQRSSSGNTDGTGTKPPSATIAP